MRDKKGAIPSKVKRRRKRMKRPGGHDMFSFCFCFFCARLGRGGRKGMGWLPSQPSLHRFGEKKLRQKVSTDWGVVLIPLSKKISKWVTKNFHENFVKFSMKIF